MFYFLAMFYIKKEMDLVCIYIDLLSKAVCGHRPARGEMKGDAKRVLR